MQYSQLVIVAAFSSARSLRRDSTLLSFAVACSSLPAASENREDRKRLEHLLGLTPGELGHAAPGEVVGELDADPRLAGGHSCNTGQCQVSFLAGRDERSIALVRFGMRHS
jgi:hypothetical protein